MKAQALNSLNQPVENGAVKTRKSWQRWGEKQLTKDERRAGWVAVVGFFGSYYRVNFAAQPINPRFTLNGRHVRAV